MKNNISKWTKVNFLKLLFFSLLVSTLSGCNLFRPQPQDALDYIGDKFLNLSKQEERAYIKSYFEKLSEPDTIYFKHKTLYIDNEDAVLKLYFHKDNIHMELREYVSKNDKISLKRYYKTKTPTIIIKAMLKKHPLKNIVGGLSSI